MKGMANSPNETIAKPSHRASARTYSERIIRRDRNYRDRIPLASSIIVKNIPLTNMFLRNHTSSEGPSKCLLEPVIQEVWDQELRVAVEEIYARIFNSTAF